MRTGDARAFGKSFFATAVNPAGEHDVPARLEARARRRSFAQLGDDGAFVDNGYAKRHHLHVGSPIELTFANGEQQDVRRQGHLRPADRRLAVRHA